jgi:NAD(P)-dependent dehydrogenase (short-subunit alcohol dehydrogenase family)
VESVAAPTFDFSDQVVVVTGGGLGVGTVIVAAFVDAGATVISCGSVETLVAGATSVIADVRQSDQAARAIASAVEQGGRLDVLVNYANEQPDEMANVVALQLLAPFYCAQAAHRVMADQPEGGVIVNVGSDGGQPLTESSAVHGAARAGLRSLTSSLAAEWAPKVRVNFVGAEENGTDPGEVANACLFLARPGSANVTGAHLELQSRSASANEGQATDSC